jgi:hypothetical protein
MSHIGQPELKVQDEFAIVLPSIPNLSRDLTERQRIASRGIFYHQLSSRDISGGDNVNIGR